MKGKVVRMVTDKGFGFIREDDTGDEYFFHNSAVKGAVFESLVEGVAVEFSEGNGAKGPRAENVRLS